VNFASNTGVRYISGKNRNRLLPSGHIKRKNLWKIALRREGNVLAHGSLSSSESRADQMKKEQEQK
jgi:hypothetical protein